MKTLVYINDLTFDCDANNQDIVIVLKNCQWTVIEGLTLLDIGRKAEKLLFDDDIESYLIPELFKGEIIYI